MLPLHKRDQHDGEHDEQNPAENSAAKAHSGRGVAVLVAVGTLAAIPTIVAAVIVAVAAVLFLIRSIRALEIRHITSLQVEPVCGSTASLQLHRDCIDSCESSE